MKLWIGIMLGAQFLSYSCSQYQIKQENVVVRKIAQSGDLDREIEELRDRIKPYQIFKDSENRGWLTFNNFKLDHSEAKRYCKKHDLELPSKSLVERLESELNGKSKQGLLEDWFWTKETYREKAWGVFVYDKGRGLGYQRFDINEMAFQVVCITKEKN